MPHVIKEVLFYTMVFAIVAFLIVDALNKQADEYCAVNYEDPNCYEWNK